MKFHTSSLFGAAMICAVLPAFADDASEAETRYDSVIVDGSRLGQTTAEIGSSVSILEAADLEKLSVDFVLDAIAGVPGVTVNQNGGFGGVASVRIRGASTGQTLVLVDGVPVGDPSATDGSFNFANLDTESIERIEILKGPQSVLWGSDAIGGVVSIITKAPEDGFGGTAFAEFGSFNTLQGGVSLTGAGEAGDFRIAATGLSSDGISKADENNGNTEDDGYEATTLSAKGGLNLGAQVRLDGGLLFNDASADFDSFVFGAEGSVGDGNERADTETLSSHLALTFPLFGDTLENAILIGYSDIERENFLNDQPNFSASGDRTILRYQGLLTVNDRNTFSFGAEHEDTSAEGQEATIDGLFALYEFKPTDALTLTGGLRLDDHDRFGSETTGKIAAAYEATDGVILRASWGQGFKAPSLFQSTYICTFCGLTEPNLNLKPETSEGFDIGVDWTSADGRAEAGITLFDQETENMIDFSFTAGYDNIALVKSTGLELYAGYQLTQIVGVTGNLTLIDAEDGNGNELFRLPEQTANVTLTLDPEGPLSGAVIVRYNGDEQNTDGTTLDGWTRLDLTGRYALTESVEFYGRIENLFDEDYQQILGYGTPGLSGSVGVRLRY